MVGKGQIPLWSAAWLGLGVGRLASRSMVRSRTEVALLESEGFRPAFSLRPVQPAGNSVEGAQTDPGASLWTQHGLRPHRDLCPPPGKLTGMSEITEKLTLPDSCRSDHIVVQKVTTVANLGRVPCGTSDEYR